MINTKKVYKYVNKWVVVYLTLMSLSVNIVAIEYFILDIHIPRISSLLLVPKQSYLRTGKNHIAQIRVQNNTSDGYNIALKSDNNAILVAEGEGDGRSVVPYRIEVEKYAGSLGQGTAQNLFPNLSLENPAIIVDTSTIQTTLTDITYDIYMIIEENDQSSLSIAGNYHDIINIIYTDY